MVMITLRILAGAAYLDMIHYQIHVGSVNDTVWDTVCELHEKINDIKQPESKDECKKLAFQWCAVQKKRWGKFLTKKQNFNTVSIRNKKKNELVASIDANFQQVYC
jgi:hypothetical protein